jgi:beta-lactamase class A
MPSKPRPRQPAQQSVSSPRSKRTPETAAAAPAPRVGYLAVITLGAGVLAGLLLGRMFDYKSAHALTTVDTEVRETGNELISPLLECSTSRAPELADFEHVLTKTAKAALDEQRASKLGIYFRDLLNGRWIGVGEDLRFDIASMGKVPTLLAYLRAAEANPSLLDQKLELSMDDIPFVQNVVPAHQLPRGSYPVRQLIENMIVHSDNVATWTLGKHLDRGEVLETMRLFGFQQQGDFMTASPRTYGGVFRVLFNASYLNRQSSVYSLELLARSEFQDGLVAGVPKGIRVAHKFGERGTEAGDSHQMHDCGIVYYPSRPYFLCVMTKGKSMNTLAAVIRDVSKAAYAQVDQQLTQASDD